MSLPSIKDIVKDHVVHFVRYRQGFFYYKIEVDTLIASKWYVFPVPMEDIGDATLESVDKAIMFMRYIRQAINNNTFLPL